ncbi:hypothetical protein [Janthinobacterium sp. 75]|uniref:hypothetical protein n=1 Tax=Janthinobacterium sp. 75 TaxID=2135628 RepID=UPI001062513D|nr:hypothetical protein [Janthinobacterium sp. 75]
MDITLAHTELLSELQPYVWPRKKMTIAVDGVDDSGKSTLARFLACWLGVPVIETDLCLMEGYQEPTIDLRILRTLIESRHRCKRPVIVEGIFILSTLEELAIVPDYVIRVESPGRNGSFIWASKFEAYADKYLRPPKHNFLFNWDQPDLTSAIE